MAYRVQIIDSQTGEARWHGVEWDWFHDDGSDDMYWWTDGNFGCDCNRFLEFERAAGKDPDDEEAVCGSGPNRYRVTHAELPDGRRIEIDGEPEK